MSSKGIQEIEKMRYEIGTEAMDTLNDLYQRLQIILGTETRVGFEDFGRYFGERVAHIQRRNEALTARILQEIELLQGTHATGDGEGAGEEVSNGQ